MGWRPRKDHVLSVKAPLRGTRLHGFKPWLLLPKNKSQRERGLEVRWPSGPCAQEGRPGPWRSYGFCGPPQVLVHTHKGPRNPPFPAQQILKSKKNGHGHLTYQLQFMSRQKREWSSAPWAAGVSVTPAQPGCESVKNHRQALLLSDCSLYSHGTFGR